MSHFDEQAKTWDDNPEKLERAKVFAQEIINFIKPDNNLNALEFGCGTGLLSFEMADAFKNITLVDTSKGMIDVLKDKIKAQNISNFHPLQQDMLEDYNNLKNIDVIFTLMTMHHIHDLDKAFLVFHKVLNANGYLCIADLIEEDGTFHRPEMNFDGYKGFNKEKLTQQLILNGFMVKHYQTPFTITKDTGKTYPLFLMIAQK